jgi:alpha-galactosidase
MMATLPAGAAAELFQPDEHEHADHHPHQRVRAVGLCHSVQGTLRSADGLHRRRSRKSRVHLRRHQPHGVLSPLEKDGVDLYPRLFEAMEKPEVYNTNKVRFEMMKRLGYFVTESSSTMPSTTRISSRTARR